MNILKDIIEAYKEDLISDTQKLIQIDSVEDKPMNEKPFGEGVDNALKYVLRKGEDFGFTSVYKDGYYGYIEMGEGEELVGILGHLDVVPVENPNEWKYPPFGGEIHDGKLYGRGAIDDKGPVMSVLYAMKAIKDSGISINKRIRLILGTNEETGWECIKKYKEEEELPSYGFTPDSLYPIINAEKGLLQLQLYCSEAVDFTFKGGNALNSVPDYCYFENNEEKKEFKGKAVHSQKCYEGENAIIKGVEYLKNNNIHSKVVDFIFNIANDPFGKSIFGEYEDKSSGKLTFNVAKIEMDKESHSLYVDIRFPVTKDKDEIIQLLWEKCKAYDIKVKELDYLPPLYVPEDHFLIKALRKVFEEETKLDGKPLYTGGATYARAFKNFVAFGPVMPGEVKTAHQRDEYIEVDMLIKNVYLYGKAIEALLQDVQ